MKRGRGKFDALGQYLSNTDKNFLLMSFAEIESILGFKLSSSAYKYPAIWSNSESHPIAAAWLKAGYKSEQLNLGRQTIAFRKIECVETKYGLINRNRLSNSTVRMSPATAVNLITDYHKETVKDSHGRYMSWRHCYNVFAQKRNVIEAQVVDYLALHLAFYLASWGMYRGSSFLLQKDYRVHIPIVKIIQEHKYDALHGISAQELCMEENLLLIDDISCRIRDCYAREHPAFEGSVNKASDTLVTKILLGTFGCVPAYDRYYVQGVKRNNISSGLYNAESVRKVAEFYCENLEVFENLRCELSKCGINYPPMKLMDMCFWQDSYMREAKQR